MDVTTPQSEPDQDNSSLQNPSTNPAEAGTTDETRDDDHETSSIEALNWSEVEEEELAAAQQAEAALSTALGILPPEKKVNNKADKDDDNVTNNDSSTNEEGSVLSTSLLQSINSTVADEDPQARKLSVIENWASEVTSAVERGEIEMAEDFPEENETTAGEEDENDFVGPRKRKGKKSSPELVASMMSSVSNGESSVDPLSNAPVLDDGPIWNKGPRSYTFQENRRINQKLTFCLLIAVVLAIGLGLGNLVAHQECEAEYRASHQQQSQMKQTDKVSVHNVPTTTTPAPIIPDRSTDSSMMGSQLPNKRPISYADSSVSEENVNDQFVTNSVNNNDKRPVYQESNDQGGGRRPRKRDEPVIDPKYKVHAETVSNVVHTLDRLSRKIDQNENTTRKLQGVLMIPEEEEKSTETSTESSLLYDEEIYMDEVKENIVDDSDTETDVDDEENEEAIIEDLIEAIEQTPDYIEMQSEKRRWAEYDKNEKNRKHSNLFYKDSEKERYYPEEQNDMELIIKSMRQFKEFQRRFIGSERKRLRQDQKYDRFNWRLPEEYTAEEKNALRVRYRSNWQDFLKLIKNKASDPVEALFGADEDEEERTYEDIFRFTYVDPKDEQSELDHLLQNRKDSPSENENNLEKGRRQTWETNSDSTSEEPIPILPESEDIHNPIKTETRKEHELAGEPTTASFKSEPIQPERVEADDDLGKSTFSSDQGSLDSAVPKVENIQSVIPTDDLKVEDRTSTTKNQGERDSVSSVKAKANKDIPSPPVNKPSKKNSQEKVTNDRKPRSQSPEPRFKTGKAESKKHTDQKNKQDKQNLKNESTRFSKDQNANTVSDGVKNKKSGKDKKVRNNESNTSFENLKGKNKKRVASPEPNGNAGTETLFAEMKQEKNSKPSFSKKKSQVEDNENKENKRGRGDTSFDKENQKVKAADNQNNNDNHQNKFNGNNGRNYKNDQSKDARYQERRNARTEQRNRQQSNENHPKNKEKVNVYPQRSPSPKQNQESKDISSEETQFRQQNPDFNVKHENRNNFKNSGNQNGKKSKSWQGKEKTDRKKERGSSSWGN